MSQWAEGNPEAVQTGSLAVDSIIQILLSTGMFVAGMTGFILDNTISGIYNSNYILSIILSS